MAHRLLLVSLLLWLSWASPVTAGSGPNWNEPLPVDSLLTIVYTGESWGEYAPCPT